MSKSINKEEKKSLDIHIFDTESQIKIGGSVYMIERHFSGGRSLAEAVYEAVKNEAKRGHLEGKNT